MSYIVPIYKLFFIVVIDIIYKTIIFFARGYNKNNPMFRRDKNESFNSIPIILSIKHIYEKSIIFQKVNQIYYCP